MPAHINGAELNFTTPSGPITLRLWGTGAKVLLLPGLGGTAVSWGKVPHLIKAAGRAALALTPPAWWYGNQLLTLKEQVATLVPLVRVLDAPLIVGWSMGARLALELAAVTPVKAWCLICPDLGRVTEAKEELLTSGARNWAHCLAKHLLPDRPDGVKVLQRVAPDCASLEAQYRMAALPYRLPFPLPAVPGMIIAGREDALCPPVMAAETAQVLGVPLVQLAGGHGLPWSQPNELVQSLLRL